MNRARYRWLLGAVAVHLSLCLLGAASFHFDKVPVVGNALEYYAELTGANSGFGFFAPGVDGQVRARFDVIDAQGKVVPGALANSDLSHEAQLRVGNIVDQFEDLGGFAEEATSDEADAKAYGNQLAQSLAASLAGKIFARYPQARQVAVHLEHYGAISMPEYRRGERAKWTAMYDVTFALKEPPTTSATEAAR